MVFVAARAISQEDNMRPLALAIGVTAIVIAMAPFSARADSVGWGMRQFDQGREFGARYDYGRHEGWRHGRHYGWHRAPWWSKRGYFGRYYGWHRGAYDRY
jgi:hypothetical protein